MDVRRDAEYEKLLPKRVRFYHSKINARALGSGESYLELKNVTVVVFMPYDPYGAELVKYTAKNQLKEVQDDRYEDGARTLFFNTGGKIRNVDDELYQLLRYMEHSTEENAATEDLRELHKIVVAAKHDEEVSAGTYFYNICSNDRFGCFFPKLMGIGIYNCDIIML